MLIVLDASILVSDFLFMGHEARTFFENLRFLGYKAYIPEIALQETVGKYSETFAKFRKEYSRLGLVVNFPFYEEDNSSIEDKYKRFLNEYINANHLNKLGYPNVSHEEVAIRALSTKRPFTSRTKGYRDTLIWLSTLELMEQSKERVALLTTDGDFYDGAKFHSDLELDLGTKNISRNQLSLYKTYREFHLQEISPHLESAESTFFLDLKSPESKIFNLKNFMENDFSDFVRNSDLSDYELELPDMYENPTFFGVEDVLHVNLDSVVAQELPVGNRYLISYHAEAWVSVDFFAFRFPAYDTSDFSIMDPHWNDDYVWALKTIRCDLSIELTLDTDKRTVESAQIVDLKRLDPYPD